MLVVCALSSGVALAKLAPPSDEAKAKAEEGKAKAAHGDKVAAFQLCNSMDKVAQRHLKENKGRKPVETPKCQDPGPFQYVAAAPAAAAVAAPAAAAAPAAPAPAAAKTK
ncbi:MAG: hypothetical protein D4S02_11605 [Rhodocyclaceae bacterium]|nr:MAG: hypothetical protein D4S02_11605 [Rhodocyclaceae bacterium]